jgi:hypothetical protein
MHHQRVEPRPGDGDDEPTHIAHLRRLRQQAEIRRLVARQQLHRAADLTHEHMAEFPDDDDVRRDVIAALDISADLCTRRRSGEFHPP